MANVFKRFGYWTVSDEGIEFNNVPNENPYEILKSTLWHTRSRYDGGVYVWDWPFHLMDKTWLTINDLADFNAALHFAQEHFKNLKPNNIKDALWKDTVEEQIIRLQLQLDPTKKTNQMIRDVLDKTSED
jgi:hypothetical protein